ncbi:sugar ABC transporter substrate-binding protein [Amaricoccus solimangrovi]|uniref:Sugar ABC transporter substrate-binding protein n=1 Tax=Amaricoccus solimangrovi TaxID=2589815 RepID=A0A501WHW0_9RHOB|nr:sugar ABC transporter substrate-binding protein [Amaricoccus solimangrovi]TPE48948.1 sugar ABC transporter substrate-binding protein [Amaricoccus solimangrovi]
MTIRIPRSRALSACALALGATLLGTAASAQPIGVTIAEFNDNFLTLLRNGMAEYAQKEGVELVVEDAQRDIGKQLSQIQNFTASGAQAIIVNAVDTDATVAMSQVAEAAGIPLVYVNYEPVNVDTLPPNQAFVASDEKESGTLETKEVCRLLKEQGKGEGARVLVLMGELSSYTSRQRTQDIHDVIATPECSFMTIAEEQTANWQRAQALDVMTNWLSGGVAFDAVIANNDEMAIGAIQAMNAAGIPKDKVVAGIDATQDGLAAMAAGDLDVTVFQDAKGQGEGAIATALRLVRGEPVEQKVYIPFELVTPATMEKYRALN